MHSESVYLKLVSTQNASGAYAFLAFLKCHRRLRRSPMPHLPH